MVVMNKKDLAKIEDEGHLPWKDCENNKWCVNYVGRLSSNSIGAKTEKFDDIFQALRFAQNLVNRDKQDTERLKVYYNENDILTLGGACQGLGIWG